MVASCGKVRVDAALHVAHERVPFAENEVVAHTERMGVHAQHRPDFLRSLAVRNLGGRTVDDDRMHAKTRRRSGPCRLRSRRVVEEHRVGQFATQQVEPDAGSVECFESGGRRQRGSH